MTPELEGLLILCRIYKHPAVHFIVVVNPNSGPGDNALPDEHYTREIPRLNACSNVRTVGYISTSWGNRALSLALEDISAYAGWSKKSTVPGLGVKGIFLDETPAIYTASGLNFLNTVAAAIKFQPGLGIDPLVSEYAVSFVSYLGNFGSRVPANVATFFFLPHEIQLLASESSDLRSRTNLIRCCR